MSNTKIKQRRSLYAFFIIISSVVRFKDQKNFVTVSTMLIYNTKK